MVTRLTRSERERLIFDFIKGKPTPGYEIIQQDNGKYRIKVKPIEIEEEEESEKEKEIEIKESEHQKPKRVKQDVNELLANKSIEINSPQDPPVSQTPSQTFPQSNYKSYKRKKLIL